MLSSRWVVVESCVPFLLNAIMYDESVSNKIKPKMKSISEVASVKSQTKQLLENIKCE